MTEKREFPKRHLVTLRILNGEYDTKHLLLMDKGSASRANTIAKTFYGPNGEYNSSTGWFEFYRCEVAVKVYSCILIPEEDFQVLSKYITIA